MKNLNAAIDKIRIKVMQRYNDNHKCLNYANDYYYFLKKFANFFKTNFDNISKRPIRISKYNFKWDKYEIRKYLLSIDKDLKEAYFLWERYYEFNFCHNIKTFDYEFSELKNCFLNSPFHEFVEFGKLLNHWKKEIKNSFITIHKSRLSKKSDAFFVDFSLSRKAFILACFSPISPSMISRLVSSIQLQSMSNL